MTTRTFLLRACHALLAGVAVACALGGVSTNVTAATAAPDPCWQTLITDWSDGQIDGRYPLSCYRSAIANEPTDLEIYSTLDDDLQTALRTQIATPSPGSAPRRTLALASRQQTAGSSSSTLTRLGALLAVLGGTFAAAWLGVVLVRRLRVHATKGLRSRP